MANFILSVTAGRPLTPPLNTTHIKIEKVPRYVLDFFKRHKDLLIASCILSGISSTLTFATLYVTCSLSLYNLTILTLTIYVVSYIYLFTTCYSDKSAHHISNPPLKDNRLIVTRLVENAINNNNVEQLKKICFFLAAHPKLQPLNRQFALRMFMKDLILSTNNPTFLLEVENFFQIPALSQLCESLKQKALSQKQEKKALQIEQIAKRPLKKVVDCLRFQSPAGPDIELSAIPLDGNIIKQLQNNKDEGIRRIAFEQNNINPDHFRMAVDIAFKEYTHLFDGVEIPISFYRPS